MAFGGWSAEALEFFEGLEADNSKTYWTAHKDVYEREVREPMLGLVDLLAPEFGAGKLFRPYRDVRFSKDKSPYKTAIAAAVGDLGYVQLSANGLACGSGMHQMAADQLGRYRAAVAAEASGRSLEAAIAAVVAAGPGVESRDQLTTAPRGYPKDHPRIALLRYKGIVCWQAWPVARWLGTAAAADKVVAFLRATRPLNEWLGSHVGPTRRLEGR